MLLISVITARVTHQYIAGFCQIINLSRGHFDEIVVHQAFSSGLFDGVLRRVTAVPTIKWPGSMGLQYRSGDHFVVTQCVQKVADSSGQVVLQCLEAHRQSPLALGGT